MSGAEQDVARLLKVREQEEKEDGEENAVGENIPEAFEVRLEDVERLQFENISIKRQLLQEQMNSTEYSLRDLVASIKMRCGAPADYDLVFDPQTNSQIVRLVKSKDGTS